MLGSLYAGIGLANAGVGAAHSLSYPLGGKYGISHGVANTLMLPRIMEYNLPGALEKFAVVAEMMGENTEGLSVRDAAMLAVEAVDTLIEDCDIATGLEELGNPRGGFPRDGAGCHDGGETPGEQPAEGDAGGRDRDLQNSPVKRQKLRSEEERKIFTSDLHHS